MHACLEVHYCDPEAYAACVKFKTWTDASAHQELTVHIERVAAYVPGRFFERELPCLLAVLKTIPTPVETLLIDGYV